MEAHPIWIGGTASDSLRIQALFNVDFFGSQL